MGFAGVVRWRGVARGSRPGLTPGCEPLWHRNFLRTRTTLPTQRLSPLALRPAPGTSVPHPSPSDRHPGHPVPHPSLSDQHPDTPRHTPHPPTGTRTSVPHPSPSDRHPDTPHHTRDHSPREKDAVFVGVDPYPGQVKIQQPPTPLPPAGSPSSCRGGAGTAQPLPARGPVRTRHICRPVSETTPGHDRGPVRIARPVAGAVATAPVRQVTASTPAVSAAGSRSVRRAISLGVPA